MPNIKDRAFAYAALLLFAGAIVMFFTLPGQTQTTPARTPFQRTLTINIPTKVMPSPAPSPPSYTTNYTASFTVPAGKRLIIENVTGDAAFPSLPLSPTFMWVHATYSLKTTAGGSAVSHVIPMDQVNDPSGTSGPRAGYAQYPSSNLSQCGYENILYETTHQVRLYADPGTTVVFQLTRYHFPQDISEARSSNWAAAYYCGAKADLMISGYLVDASSGALSPLDDPQKSQ